jgi:hypothetical protein
MSKAWLPPKPSGNDLNIMEYLVSQKFSPKQLIRLNRCRLYLQLLSLSDMVSADGKQIISSVLEGRQLVDRRSSLEWPEQGNPSRADWTLWASAFQPLHTKFTLQRPITMFPNSQHQTWFWYMDRNNSLFHHVDGKSWEAFTLLPRRRYPSRNRVRNGKCTRTSQGLLTGNSTLSSVTI